MYWCKSPSFKLRCFVLSAALFTLKFNADGVLMGSNCHYFAYEPALKYSFEINSPHEMESRGDIVRYEHCDRKEKQFCMKHYQMVTHPSANPRDCLITKVFTDSQTSAFNKVWFPEQDVNHSWHTWVAQFKSITTLLLWVSYEVSKPERPPESIVKKSAQLTKYVQCRLMYSMGIRSITLLQYQNKTIPQSSLSYVLS